ncbi:MAG: HAD hydrolase family protein [Actinomycetota bacterium]|nr:HAD hydrolase family protein [Actinomycetota bacterium]
MVPWTQGAAAEMAGLPGDGGVSVGRFFEGGVGGGEASVLTLPDLSGIRLLATDLDGTFLDAAGVPVRRSATAARAARERGVHVVAATARGQRSTRAISLASGLGPLAVCANGAVGLDLATGGLLWTRTIAQERFIDIVETLTTRDRGFKFAVETVAEFVAEAGFFPRVPEVLDATQVIQRKALFDRDQVVKLVVRYPGMGSAELAAMLGGLVGGEQVIPGSIDWVEVVARGVSKGLGVGMAADALGVGTEQVAVVGDHLNDLPMFAVTKYSFAVGNGHAKALEMARWVVGSNVEGGVGEVADRLGPSSAIPGWREGSRRFL